MTAASLHVDLAAVAAEVLRPPVKLSPSEWAAAHRVLPEGATEKPGRWDPDYFPHLAPIMDAVEEGLRDPEVEGVVCMKSGQGGGSDSMVNTVGWARTYVAGPLLYLISKDDKAAEFVAERFLPMARTAAPLQPLLREGKGSGTTMQRVVFSTGKLDVLGGRSVLNMESTPYAIVWIDEIDSLQDSLPGKGDLIKNVKARTKASRASTLLVAFAHPTTSDRGAGKLYYHQSDQRRLFVDCPHCAKPAAFWLSWDHVRVFPEGDETMAQAERIAERYAFVAPCCGALVSDAQRVRAIRTVRLVSELSPEERRGRRWIGVHFSELYYPHRKLRELAADWIDGLDNEEVARAITNKSHGEVYEPKVQETSPEDWRGLIRIPRSVSDPEAYVMGEVPPGVRFLTAGQDSRSVELHYTVWGWGLLRNAGGTAELVAWLIECGILPRAYTPTIEAADLEAFDQLLHARTWPRTDGSGSLALERAYFDSGWCPLAVAEYVRERERFFACKGDNANESSKLPSHRWGAPMRYRAPDGTEVVDEATRPALLNTYRLKERWYGLVPRRFERAGQADLHPRIVLPQDVPETFLEQVASEYLAKNKQGKKTWLHKGPNHYADCSLYAYAAALNLNPFQKGKTRDELLTEAKAQAAARARARSSTRTRAAAAKRGRGPRGPGPVRPIRTSY